MTNQHTPGPWTAIGPAVYFPAHTNPMETGGFDISNCPHSEANARLIATAPELLEALQEALAALADNVGMQDTYIDFDQVRNAKAKASASIAKAIGQAS